MRYVDHGPSDGPPVVLGTDNTLRKGERQNDQGTDNRGKDG